MKASTDATLTGKAYREIEERIVTLKLLPGEVLSESMLVDALGIGRTPIREALQQLAREGLVIILPRRGVVVSELDVRRQLELLKVRRELERLIVTLAAERATAAERDRFLAIAEGMREAADSSDDVAFMRLDREFNLFVSDVSRNEFAQRAISMTHGLSRRFWYVHYKQVLDLPLCATLHAKLADAIASGECQESAQASDRLVDYIEEFTRASLDAPMLPSRAPRM
ncbi:MAG: GntR family transcriptional regulator [Hyphomicrobiaceae bacterium]